MALLQGDPMTKITTSTPFKDMTPTHKVTFILKLAACIISFGFIFPNVMND
jgi:hypothetical protein